MRWLLTGQKYDPADADRIGLIHEAVEPGGLASTMLARRFAAEIM